MRKNHLLAIILIAAILITAFKLVDLNYSSTLDTSDDDGSQIALRDNNVSRSAAEFDFILLLAMAFAELFILRVLLHRIIAEQFSANSFLFENFIFIRPPPINVSS